ncbi:hypothetical protein FACS189464_1880 [Bacteroidia bacterium]|nr:hypothetical protein FACS189464_1880 [Bacteroidia bacterium]
MSVTYLNGNKVRKVFIAGSDVKTAWKGGVKIFERDDSYSPVSDEFVFKFTIAAGGKMLIRQYFSNAIEIDWGQGGGYEPFAGNVSSTIQEKIYADDGEYILRVRKTSGERWLMSSTGTSAGYFIYSSPVIPIDMLSMPPFSLFGDSETHPGNNFFYRFCIYGGGLRSLPEGSFDTSKIVALGSHAFEQMFAGNLGNPNYPSVAHLPAGSFRFDALKTVGTHFFNRFVQDNKAIKALPMGSFNFEGITSQSGDFCVYFSINSGLNDNLNPTGNAVSIKNMSSGAVNFTYGAIPNIPAGSYIQYAGE